MNLMLKKKQLAQAIRTLSEGGVFAQTVGHASMRLTEDTFLMLGHTHKAFKTLDEITEDDMIVVDLDGNVLEGKYKAPGEVYIHTEVYRSRPDVGGIVHGHPKFSEIIGISGKPYLAVDHRAYQFASGVPVMDFAGQINTMELGVEVAEILGDHTAMILRGHGQVIVGDDLEEACCNAFLFEDNAEKLLVAYAIGTPQPLKESELRKKKPTSVWIYYVKKYDPRFKEVGYLF